MPLYTYQCHNCQQQFDVRRSILQADEALDCRYCGSQNTSKIFNAIAVIGSSTQSRPDMERSGCSGCASRMPSACASCRR